MKITQYVSSIAVLCLSLGACGGGGGTPSYTVAATVGTGGSISPGSAAVNEGGTTSFTVTPDTGYSTDTVSGCGGSLSGDTYTTGAVTADCTVTASFTLNSYTVSTSAGTGGAISPSPATVDYNGTTSFTVTPDTGYSIDTVSGCGGSLSGSTYTTGAITADCTVTASFIATHTVSTSAGTGGAISPTSATVNDGGTTSFTVTPDTGYVLASVSGCGGSLSGDTYTTGAITADCTVTAAFDMTYTWVSGSDTVNASGVYGTQGTPASANVPGARDGVVTWTDAGGDLWLFGGYGYDIGGNQEYLNDMWKYDTSSGEWTWMSGSDTGASTGNWGTKGVAAVGNTPGARTDAVSWSDSSGNLWLFGGYGNDSGGPWGLLNDLWKYDIATGEWTWMSGSDTRDVNGVYGTRGTAAASNTPGSRSAAVSWSDTSGNLWLFGGGGFDSVGNNNDLNDLWQYNIATGEWIWMSGPDTATDFGVYGTLGTPDAANVPGGREYAVSWSDTGGNLWLFGGVGWDSANNGDLLNDLWKYNIATGEWTWMSGSNLVAAYGVYGTLGTADAGNTPGARVVAAGWTDTDDNLWLFGGYALDSANTGDDINDLWKYDIATGEWTWMGGSDGGGAVGVYGNRGTPAAGNVIGGREHPGSWIDAGGTVWLFGGWGYDSSGTGDYLNDLWSSHP